MEQLLETVDLAIDESNDLKFKIKMEGNVSSPAKVRLVCEGEDFSYVFNGYGTGESEVVQFTLPRMENKVKEGVYNAKVEVLVENRYFAPLQFQINFKKTVSVVAEAVRVVPKVQNQDIKITATPIVASKASSSRQIEFEKKPEAIVETKAEEKTKPENKISALREKYLKNILENDNEVEASSGKKLQSLREVYLAKKLKRTK